eukprot:6203814-Pleurochrysis_carterae.AAC.1
MGGMAWGGGELGRARGETLGQTDTLTLKCTHAHKLTLKCTHAHKLSRETPLICPHHERGAPTTRRCPCRHGQRLCISSGSPVAPNAPPRAIPLLHGFCARG